MRGEFAPPAQASRLDGDGDPLGSRALPAHVAIIMDGNGRWAAERGQPRSEGHRAGTENIRRVIESFVEHGIKYLTVFAFSTENWSRPENEVNTLLELLGEAIREETLQLHERGVRIRHLGRLDRLAPVLRDAIRSSVELTRDNSLLTLNVAFDYGGRDEILGAVRRIVRDGLSPEQVDEETFRRYLFTAHCPDPDLIIRTGGEQRISNFLLWQSAYSEFYHTCTLWPDLQPAELEQALDAYRTRQRRYGKISEPET